MAKGEDALAKDRAAARKVMYAALDKNKVTKGAGRAVADLEIEPITRQSFGSIKADWATGGGIPYGRITEIYGAEGSGKTTLALRFLAEAQAAGKIIGFIDAEHGFDAEWAGILGVDVQNMMLLQPDHGEQAFQVLKIWLEHDVQAVVVDSVAALVPEAELKGEIGEAHVGRQARLMSAGLRYLAGTINHKDAAVVFINQLREKVGNNYGSPETTPGGRALKFYASLRLDVRRGEPIKDSDSQTGTHIKVTTKKNRGSQQFRKVQVPLLYGVGFNVAYEVIDLAVDAGLITKAGAWYSYGDQRMGLGRDTAVQWLMDHPEVIATLIPKVTAFLDTGEIISEGSDE